MMFNRLTASQIERLALLLEELGEAQQAIGKVLRHSYACYNPDAQERICNKEALEKELGDVLFAIELICVSKDLDESNIENKKHEKAVKVWRYLHHQRAARRLYAQRYPVMMARRGE